MKPNAVWIRGITKRSFIVPMWHVGDGVQADRPDLGLHLWTANWVGTIDIVRDSLEFLRDRYGLERLGFATEGAHKLKALLQKYIHGKPVTRIHYGKIKEGDTTPYDFIFFNGIFLPQGVKS